MKKTFDNEKFIKFTEKYTVSTIINTRYGAISGSEDLSSFVSMVKLYRVYLRNYDNFTERNPFAKNIYHLIDVGESELYAKLHKQAVVVIEKTKYLNMWASRNATAFITRKIMPEEDPVALANELVATLYVLALCL